MMGDRIPSYPKVWHFGHKAVEGMLDGDVIVQEKVDGSQISFGIIDGELLIRSKGASIHVDAPDSMFATAVEIIRSEAKAGTLVPGYVYRGEYLAKPKHNTLKYDRTPTGHIAIFDVQCPGAWLNYNEAAHLASEAGLDWVPTLHIGRITSLDDLLSFMELESYLGGPKVEGVVVKNYDKLSHFGDPCFAKYVSEAFKEQHRGDWKNRNPNGQEFVELLGSEFCVEPRFRKAVQHLREAGVLKDDPSDIGPLMKELASDFESENKDEVMERLYAHFRKKIVGAANKGFPEFYKQQLAAAAFEEAA